jgi:hypothetical protein
MCMANTRGQLVQAGAVTLTIDGFYANEASPAEATT